MARVVPASCKTGDILAKLPAVPTPSASPSQINAMQRAQVLASAVEMKQQIFSQTFAGPITGANNVINVVVRNVGLIKRFLVEITETVNTGVGDALTLSDLGEANLLQQAQFVDLNNNVRVNTSGWHLKMVESYKNRNVQMANYAFASVGTSVQDLGAGATFAILQAPPTIAASSSGVLRNVFEIPLAYHDDDLRGSVYGNVVNATMNLQLTLTPAAQQVVQNTLDSTLAVYTDAQAPSAGVTVTNVTVTVYQVYLDQLPQGKNGVVLPILDLSTIYELKNTSLTAIAVGQDFPVPYTNFRDFLSTSAIFNNGTSAGSAGRTAGTDVNYWALQSANFTNLWKVDPLLAAQEARQIIHTDIAKGVYYFTHRRKPISTTQYGNMELILNPSVAVAGNYILVGFEDFALVNTLTQAGSLAAG